MNKIKANRFNELYQRHLRLLKLQDKTAKLKLEVLNAAISLNSLRLGSEVNYDLRTEVFAIWLKKLKDTRGKSRIIDQQCPVKILRGGSLKEF